MTDKDKMATDEFMKSLDALEKLAHGETQDSRMEKSVEGDNTADQDELFAEPAEALEKSDPGEDDEDTGEDADEDTEKSFAGEAAESSETIQKAIEVSDFLADLVGEIGNTIDGIRTSVETRLDAMEKSIANQADFNKSLATALRKSFEGTRALLEKSIADGEDLKKSLEAFGNQPAHGPKSRTSVLEKSFSVNGDDKEPLSKSQILERMTNAVLKGDGLINGVSICGNDVMQFELNRTMRPDLKKALGLAGD